MWQNGGMTMAHCSRRNFLKAGLGAAVLGGLGGNLARSATKRTATDWVTLGKSGVKVTRLAFGTGTYSGRIQRQLGQDEFTRLVRHSYDRGIRFFETSESYGGMHEMLGIALKGLPRDSYQIMSKVTTSPGVDAQAKIDELRKLAKTDYFDIILMHYQHVGSWPTDTVRWQDGILEAQNKKALLGHGASVHGLPALRQVPDNKWLDIAMIRMNHKGAHMDAEDYRASSTTAVDEVVLRTKEAHLKGMGVISMKLAGEGEFKTREDRQKALKFAFDTGAVDSVTIGYKSIAEVDEAIDNLNLALA
jgi:aryl-alcohol dehydrogenase-like predicted oxidoreductase